MRLVIADDEVNVRDGLVSLVHEVAPDVRIVGQACTVEEVIELVRLHQPEIVLLDIHMPDGSGLDAAAGREDDNRFPLWIVVTAYPVFEYAQRAVSLKVFDYLLKPVSAEEMRSTLNRARAEAGRRLTAETGIQVAESETTGTPAPSPVQRHDIAALARALIDSQYSRPIGVAQIAGQLGVSPNYLSTTFRRRHGETPIHYLTRVRIEQGARLLLLGYRVTEVAALVGFHDTRHFSRLFSRHWGSKPSEYVRNRGGSSSKGSEIP